MKTSDQSKSNLKAYYNEAYGRDALEEEIQLYQDRLVKFFLLLIEIDKRNNSKHKVVEPKAKDPKAILNSMIELHENIDQPIAGKETIIVAHRFGKALETRSQAEPLKERLKSNIKNNILTKLNFKDVRIMTASFADEAIAILVVAAGQEHFNRKVVITNATQPIKDMIAYVIQGRIELYCEHSLTLSSD